MKKADIAKVVAAVKTPSTNKIEMARIVVAALHNLSYRDADSDHTLVQKVARRRPAVLADNYNRAQAAILSIGWITIGDFMVSDKRPSEAKTKTPAPKPFVPMSSIPTEMRRGQYRRQEFDGGRTMFSYCSKTTGLHHGIMFDSPNEMSQFHGLLAEAGYKNVQ